jgi:hypothetical protein
MASGTAGLKFTIARQCRPPARAPKAGTDERVRAGEGAEVAREHGDVARVAEDVVERADQIEVDRQRGRRVEPVQHRAG